jgi:type VI protein secretion system component VasA
MVTFPDLLTIVAELCFTLACHVWTSFFQLNDVLALFIGTHCQIVSFLQLQAHLVVAMAFVLREEALPT